MSFIRHASSGHYEDIVAMRARVLAICPPSHRRRILGQAPRYRPAKTHEIVVDLKTGDRQVVSGPTAAPRAIRVVKPSPPPVPAPVAIQPIPRNILSNIVDAAAEAFGVTAYELYSAARHKPFCRARFACYWLASTRHNLSLHQIGKPMMKDHSSVLHGIRRARWLYEHDAGWRAKYDAAVALLDGDAK